MSLLPHFLPVTRHMSPDGHFAVTWGVLDRTARAAFMNGQCHAFAKTLSDRTGLPVYRIGSGECCYDTDCEPMPDDLCSCQITHVVVADVDRGVVYDAEGVWPIDDLAATHPAYGTETELLAPVTAAQFDWVLAGHAGWLPAHCVFAESVIDEWAAAHQIAEVDPSG